MYKIMIVEDEPLARQVIVNLIKNNLNDVEITSEVDNGWDAIEQSRKNNPDIIIMDIKIPGINGIEASRQILDELPSTMVLILTAYDDFNYVQQALNFGAKGYLLKPINRKEFIEKINKCIININDNKRNTDLNKKIENSVSVVKPVIEKEIIDAFINGNVDSSEIRSYLNFFNEDIDAGYFMLISYDNIYSDHINDSVRYNIIRKKIFDVNQKFLPLMRKCLLGKTAGNIFIVFFPVDGYSEISRIVEESIVISNEIKRKIKVIAGVDVYIGIGNVHNGIQDLRNSYIEAYEALNMATDSFEVVHFQTVKEENHTKSAMEYPVKLENELVEKLRAGDFKNARELINVITVKIFNGINGRYQIIDYIGQLMSIIKRMLQQHETDKSLLNNIGMLTEVKTVHNLEDLEIWFRNSVNTLLLQAEKQNRQRDTTIIDRIQKYINSSFYKDITLEIVAEEVGLSPQYLSRLFKEEFGVNFIDYITEKRVNFAKKLLLSDKKSISEVSKDVGYYDISYFCRVFKKVTGMTAKQFRQRSHV